MFQLAECLLGGVSSRLGLEFLKKVPFEGRGTFFDRVVRWRLKQ
jgi:hypothetical protein